MKVVVLVGRLVRHLYANTTRTSLTSTELIFFILAGSKSRIVYDMMDVYPGRNDCNVGIAEEFKNLPTTMKAVLNAVMHLEISNGSNDVNGGFRVVAMDNRYQCAHLAYLLWHR